MSPTQQRTWLLASGNAGKAREFEAALAGRGITLGLARDAGVPQFPPENGTTYEENALMKAGHAALHGGQVALADDSGLEVDALDGAPGVHSARFGGAIGDGERIAHLLQHLRRVPDGERGARFVAVLVLASPDGDVHAVRGECRGRILQGPRGDGGHGYDPVFYSDDLGMTFAEADMSAKQRVSHRGRALAALLAWLDDAGAGFGRTVR
ncbi:MAG: RdgB/HAM1 family non-canonical purine NTP pyrophosphatase [Trueperaceae bacterium]|nr:MAG: RdgB/HAM1 family non-canonical purine NTP pyrophosphatase [Trueperaceae bacterium]